MWFIKSKYLKMRYGSLTFKMRNFTESYQEECREGIKQGFAKITAKLPSILTRIKLKDAKKNMYNYYQDIIGRRIPIQQPIFTENEVAKINQNRKIYKVVLVLLIAFESFLFSMVAYALTPRELREMVPGIEYLIGFMFALLFVALLRFGLKGIWEFHDAKYLIERDNLDKIELKPFLKNLIFAIILIVIFVVFNISGALIRAEIIEGGKDISMVALLFSVGATFAAALAMGWLEKEKEEKDEKYKVFKNWKRQQKERKNYNTSVKKMLQDCLDLKNIEVEIYWAIVKDLQRVFEIEVDADKEELYSELNQKVANGEIDLQNLDETTYQKYLDVAITRHELFEYGIKTDPEITETLSLLKAEVAKIEEFEQQNKELNINGEDKNLKKEQLIQA